LVANNWIEGGRKTTAKMAWLFLYSRAVFRVPIFLRNVLRLKFEMRVFAIHIFLPTRVTKPTLVSIIHSDPAFAKLLISYLLSRIGRIEEDFLDQLFNSSEKRLARTLLLLASFGKSSKTEPAVLKVSQGTLAEMIGTTRSRASYFMNRFRKMGLIGYNGSVQVHRTLLAFFLQA
jgi:CRP/FNR family cyclic AMP-dependent transcriptional regulator